MNSPNKIGDYFSRRFPFFTIFSNTSYPELALLVEIEVKHNENNDFYSAFYVFMMEFRINIVTLKSSTN